MRPTHILLMTLLCLLALATPDLYAQDGIRYAGRVLDAETGEPVSYAQVRVQGSLSGDLTDMEGWFEVQSVLPGATLEVSHVSYERKFVRATKGLNGKMVIQMLPKEIRIDDIVISDGLERVFEDPTLHLYDYEFFEDDLFVITYDRKRKRSVLGLVDARDSIIDQVDLAEKPGKLVKDCMGNVHAISKHLACQVFAVEDRIGVYQDSLHLYQEYVEPCIGNIDEFYYFAYRRFNNQILQYLVFDAEVDKYEFFAEFKDKERMHQLLDPHPDNPYNAIATTEAEFLAISPEQWEEVARLNAEFQFQQLAFFAPVYAPLRTIHGQLYIFDHLNGELVTCDKDGTELRKTPIDYHKHPDWKKGVLVDEVRGEAYIHYERNGYYTLKEVDLESGEILGSYEVPRQFPMKITVRDGVLYFMYKDSHYDPTNRLFRQRLK